MQNCWFTTGKSFFCY